MKDEKNAEVGHLGDDCRMILCGAPIKVLLLGGQSEGTSLSGKTHGVFMRFTSTAVMRYRICIAVGKEGGIALLM